MFSLFLVASFVLPTVLGNCCLPDKMTALSYTAGDPSLANVLVDFSQGKYIVQPQGGDVKFVLNDLNTGKEYVKFDDGSCVADINPIQFKKCIPDTFKGVGSNVLGKTLNVNSYATLTDKGSVVVTFTDDCLPVLTVQIFDGETTTRIYTNVSTTVTDVSDLNQDVSSCQEED